jgi:hypothetical protein
LMDESRSDREKQAGNRARREHKLVHLSWHWARHRPQCLPIPVSELLAQQNSAEWLGAFEPFQGFRGAFATAECAAVKSDGF